jgi:kumamolisin
MTSLPDPADLDLRPLPGSERAPAPGVRGPSARLPGDQRVEVTLVLRRRQQPSGTAAAGPAPGSERPPLPLTREQLAERSGADPADVDLVVRTLTGLGLEVVETDPASRRVRVAGPVDLLGRVFGTSLEQVRSTAPDGAEVSHRHRTGGLSVPGVLDGVVTAVLGLDDRPQSRAQFRITPAAQAATSYTPVQLGAVYGFPDGTDGSGQSVAIIELGGGYEQSDLDAYFGGLGLSGVSVRAVGVDGAANQPGQDPQGADGEVMLDIEVVGALAPKAGIVVYFAPNTDAGFLDAVTTAAQASPAPVAMSISWGQSEDQWTAQARTAMDDAFTDAVSLGVTVTAAAGDNGSADGETDGAAHVDFPSSSPHVLACGGTSLQADPTSGAVHSETVWNDGSGGGATGGGVSDVFPLPDWQGAAGVPAKGATPGRGVPDVAADADPQTGYQVRVDGRDLVIGGTSAVAPLWAALVARLAQTAGRPLGLLQPTLYASARQGAAATGFRDITSGSNGDYSAASGWDPCTGLGVPLGSDLAQLFGTS